MSLPAAIGRYEIVARLATGGMAEILLARIRGPESFERPIVIKRILGHLTNKNLEKMFLEEARIAASIRHPNVVQVHELGSEGGELYLAMEYLEGESASSLVRRLTITNQRLGYALAAYIAAEISAGLNAAHDLCGFDKEPLKLVHRDVSPHNVFVTYDGDVKLLDFGIAKTTASSTKTEAGTVKGKLAYMSPEQCQGHPLDRRSDVFSLGIVLYELITGRQLFQRQTALLTMQAITSERVVPLTALDPEIPHRLSDICLTALARNRADRFATAAEMRRELIAVQRSLAPDDDLREELGLLMRSLYADRMAAKEHMLKQVRGGQSPDHVPEGEADIEVDIPSAIDATVRDNDLGHRTVAGTSMDRTRSIPPSRVRSRVGLALGAVALLAVGGGTVYQLRGSTPVAAQASMPSADPSGSATEPAGPAMVGVLLNSVPPGATVTVDGEERGVTPVSLRVRRSQNPVHVELAMSGFTTLKQDVVPDVEQKLVLSLVAERRAVPPTRPATTIIAPSRPPAAPNSAPVAPPPTPSATEGFTRFN